MGANLFSLLVIRCPFKPFVDLDQGTSSDPLSSRAQEFTWQLSDGLGLVGQSGIGSIDSMPYADQVLVLIPSLDVRLIDMKMPLVSDKKLQAILPGLMDEYLLHGINDVQMQVLPPMPQSPALQRTVAIIDRAWFAWLGQQFMGLLSRQVRVVPDCFLLKPIQVTGVESNDKLLNQPNIVYEFRDQNVVWTVRLSEQMGASWVEGATDMHSNAANMFLLLPIHLRTEKIAPLEWTWLMDAAHRFIGQAEYAGINLLPSTFRSRTRSGRVLAGVHDSQEGSIGLWSDVRIWRSSLQWVAYCCASIFIGMGLHLSWLMLADWRWGQQMQLWAIPYLSASSRAALEKDHDQSVLSAFTKLAIEDKRRHGLVSHADFAQMTADLQRLNAVYGGAMLESLEYDGYSLKFQVKPGVLGVEKVSPAELVTKANSMGLGVIALGGNQFRLHSYAGLGASL